MLHLILAAVTVANADTQFVRHALAAGTAEIAQGETYSDTTDQTVATYAHRMVTDHGTANTALLSIARNLDITVPNSTLPGGPSSPEAKSPQSKNAHAMPPVAYFERQIADHERAIALFKREAADGQNAQIVDFAKKTLPVLEEHLRLAKSDLQREKSRRH